jgi:probable F420-dependent oxidoreductase
MTPLFKPGPSPYGPPRVFLAGVGRPMTAVAGEVGDGLFVHPLNSPTFLRETTLPALETGFARSGRTRERFEIACQAMVVTGFDDEEMARAEMGTRLQIAFYGSTPAYRVVLDAHGWGDLQPELNVLSKEGRWTEMGGLITDDILETFAVRCTPDELPSRLGARYAGLVDRLSLVCHSSPQKTDPERWAQVIARLQAL